jgi:hypothetical protein
MAVINSQPAAMPWKCPACRDPIAHAAHDEHPRSHVIYRCHVCRVELVFDPTANKLIAAATEEHDEGPRPRVTR